MAWLVKLCLQKRLASDSSGMHIDVELSCVLKIPSKSLSSSERDHDWESSMVRPIIYHYYRVLFLIFIIKSSCSQCLDASIYIYVVHEIIIDLNVADRLMILASQRMTLEYLEETILKIFPCHVGSSTEAVESQPCMAHCLSILSYERHKGRLQHLNILLTKEKHSG